MPDFLPCVDRQFFSAIGGFGRRRQHFGDPIKGELEGSIVRDCEHSFAPPAGEVGHEHVFAEMQLGLVKDDPAARAIAAAAEGIANHHRENRSGSRVGSTWARLSVQFPVNDLRNQVRGHGDQVAVGCSARRGIGHVGESNRNRALLPVSGRLPPPSRELQRNVFKRLRPHFVVAAVGA